MSEQSYLTKPSGANARMDIAEVEGSLSYIVDNIGTEWCSNQDISRILNNAMKTLQSARQESRNYEESLVVNTRTALAEALIV